MDSPEAHPAVAPATPAGLTVRGDSGRRLISAAEFQELADVPAAAEWLANVDNPNTRRAYGSDVGEFMSMLGIRRFGELRLVRLTVGLLHEHRGVPHFRVTGKGSKTRPVPVHQAALSALGDYLELAGHRSDRHAPLFQPTQARWAGRPLTGDGIYKLVRKYASAAAIPMERTVHALRATAATNALEHEADIARVQDWLGHANVSAPPGSTTEGTGGPRTVPRSGLATERGETSPSKANIATAGQLPGRWSPGHRINRPKWRVFSRTG